MKNIKLIRVTKDYTQLKVQMDTGISQSTLSKYECGELLPTTENLQKEGNRILSTKKTDAPSGIGLENVDAIVRKYHGECRCFTEKSEFVFQLLLPEE